jgi:hypothetical protein
MMAVVGRPFLSDQEQCYDNPGLSSCIPAGKEGIYWATVAVCLGKEFFGNVKADFTGKVPDPCLLDSQVACMRNWTGSKRCQTAH